MTKRAAIYVRVSTEKQTEGYSPAEQEKDCRELCEARGYIVTAVYRDIERYRVGRKMVEPSGTRTDRPALRAMLAAADAGQFDLITAWREDRLYRGLRPMLDVIDCVERAKIDIELAKETFDRRMAPIKAAIARMELEAIKERYTMGRIARVASGRALPSNTPYGYTMTEDGRLEECPAESVWVRRVFQWYAEGLGLAQIRRRLIAGGAQQRQEKSWGQGRRRVAWNIQVIQHWLARECYWTGSQAYKMPGRALAVPTPVLIDPETAQAAINRRAAARVNPAHHTKHPFLAQGLAYCEGCGVKLQAKSRWRKRYNSDKWLEMTYACKYCDLGYWKEASPNSDCCRTVSARLLDARVWEKVAEYLKDDSLFERRIEARLAELRAQEADAAGEVERLRAHLADLAGERDRVITWGRKKIITEAEMSRQLAGLADDENETRAALATKAILTGGEADRLKAFAQKYRAQLRTGAAFALAEDVTTTEAQGAQFVARREVVEAIVKRITVHPDKSVTVIFDLTGPGGASDDGLSDKGGHSGPCVIDLTAFTLAL